MVCFITLLFHYILLSGHNVQSYHDFWFREPHLFNFSAKTLKICLEKAGFKGEIKGAQRYNLLNHLHWKFLKKPQKSDPAGQGTRHHHPDIQTDEKSGIDPEKCERKAQRNRTVGRKSLQSLQDHLEE